MNKNLNFQKKQKNKNKNKQTNKQTEQKTFWHYILISDTIKIGQKKNYKTNVLYVFILINGTLCTRCYSLNKNGQNSCSGHSNHHKSSYHRLSL